MMMRRRRPKRRAASSIAMAAISDLAATSTLTSLTGPAMRHLAKIVTQIMIQQKIENLKKKKSKPAMIAKIVKIAIQVNDKH